MIDAAGLRYLNAEAAKRARRLKLRPRPIPENLTGIDDPRVKQIPNIGSLPTPGLTEVDTLFVDVTGYGSESEPALTHRGFIARIRELQEEHKGEQLFWAITSAYQFQAYVVVYTGRWIAKEREHNKVAPNTVQFTDSEGNIRTRLYETDIIIQRPDGTQLLYTDGHRTRLTIDRINRFSRARIFTVAKKWKVAALVDGKINWDTAADFAEGIAVAADGTVSGGAS